MKRLPITKAQRAQIVGRARMAERNRCIRIVRSFFEWKDRDDRERGSEIVKAIILRREVDR